MNYTDFAWYLGTFLAKSNQWCRDDGGTHVHFAVDPHGPPVPRNDFMHAAHVVFCVSFPISIE